MAYIVMAYLAMAYTVMALHIYSKWSQVANLMFGLADGKGGNSREVRANDSFFLKKNAA